MKKLVIVESPTKVKTISKYLPKDCEVTSSKGHIMDLPKKNISIDVEKDFEPHYDIIPGKESVVKELKKSAKEVDEIILATDLDREGEAISWHVHELLNSSLKKKKKFSRVVFHEITKKAIEEAFQEPRELNYDLVDAYQARRALDRIVGYELSPLLWEKIRYGLSAGRVQSIGVRLVVEREREREAFTSEEFFNFLASLSVDGGELEAKLYTYLGDRVEEKVKVELFAGDYSYTKGIFTNEKEAAKRKKDFEKHVFSVKSVVSQEVTRSAQPPLTTARLQRFAVSRFGFSSKRVMSIAQRLYEAGFITYHRTDSTFLSDIFISDARKYIEKQFGKEFIPQKKNLYKTKSKSAQEAHEAIRPTDVTQDLSHKSIKKLTPDQKKIYQLIWNAAVSSQMAPAKLQRNRIDIVSSKKVDPVGEWRASGTVVLFPGWLKVAGTDISEENILPTVQEGEVLQLIGIQTSQHETSPPPRYNEASIIKDLEKHGIGRPSTYSSIISTIQNRGYVEKEDKAFKPRDTGFVVNDLLVNHFADIVDLDFTAGMEADLDRVADGKKKWKPLIKEFYGPFHKNVVAKKKEIKKEDLVVLEKTDEECPECKKHNLIVKLGKYGKFLSCSGFPDCKYAAPMHDDLEAQQDFGKCNECKKGDMILKQGRYGKFIACSNYPDCKHTEPYQDKIEMACPDCGSGEVVIKKTKKGRVFYGCSRYPDCEYASWKDPRQQ